jgi:hypothetical protein
VYSDRERHPFRAAVALDRCGKSGNLEHVEQLYAELTARLEELQAETQSFAEKRFHSQART